jgi:asparagine synthase (glutamine-hydrolysing)
MSESEAVDLLEERLTSSIKYRLVADVPVGTFMSGGNDSTTISGMASRLHPGIKAFTLAYEGNAPEFDEVEQARATAAINPMEHIVHTVKPEATLKYLDKWVEGYEEPFYHLAANYVISGLVKDNGVTVVLNGLGGDELFAGYPYYRIAHNYHLIRLCGPVFRRAGSIANMLKMPKANQIMRLSNTLSQDRLHTSLLIRWPEEELHRLFSVQELKGFSAVEYVHTAYADQLSFTDPVEAFSYMDLMNYIGNHQVHRVDQFTMAHSIEGRFTFLDHNLIVASFTIPTDYKLKGNVH